MEKGFAALPDASDTDTVGELAFHSEVRRRMMTMDETHHPFSNEGKKGGPRGVTHCNPSLPRGGTKTVRSNRHATGARATTSIGEVLPPVCIFDSDAQSSD